MTLPKTKVVWRTPVIEGAKWRLGLFCLYDARVGSAGRKRAWRMAISLRGVLAWLAGLAVAAYFMAAGVLWLWLGQRPYNYVTYSDLILPTHWSQLHEKRGQSQIEEGLEDFKNHNWSGGEMKLRIGLAKAPGNTKACLELARFYLAINQRGRAKAVLNAGLASGYPGAIYIRQMCAAAADGEDYDWWIATCDTALAQLTSQSAKATDRKEVFLQKLAALMAAGRTEEVIRVVDAQGDNRRAAFDEFKVLALLKAGRAGEAVAFLDGWRARSGVGPQVVRLQVRAFREAGRLADMEAALAELRGYGPTTTQPYIYGIIQYLLAGQRVEADRGVEDFLLRFGGSLTDIMPLAEPLAEIDDRPVLERLVAYARQQGFEPELFQRALIKVMIDKGDYREAKALIVEVRSSPKPPGPALDFWYEIMERLANASLDPAAGAQSFLTDYIGARRLPLKMTKDIITTLRHAGRPATARVVITFAQGVYPENDTLKIWRDELDKELAPIVETKPAVVAFKPSAKPVAPGVPAAAPAVRELLREDAFFKQLAEAKKAGDFAGALKQIQNLREAAPDWLGAREDEIEREEIRLNGRLGDLPSLRLAASLYVNGDAKHSLKAAELARELHAEGFKDAAIFLAKEILRKVPDYPMAKRLLAEWEPKPAAASAP